jgi:heptosyltransferase-2
VPADLRAGLRISTELGILQTAGLLAAADLCVGNDTGAINLAAAVGSRCLCVLGHRPVLAHDPLICCLGGQALDEIRVERVLEQILSLQTAPACAA